MLDLLTDKKTLYIGWPTIRTMSSSPLIKS